MNKTVKTLIIVLVCVLVAAGGIFTYARIAASKPVSAVMAGNWLMGYMPNQTWLYGVAAAEGSQTVYLEGDEKLLELYVAEGDTVEVGTPILKLDGTQKELELTEKKLKLARLELQLQEDYKAYKKLARQEYEEPLLTPTPKPEKKKTAAVGGYGMTLSRLGNVTQFSGSTMLRGNISPIVVPEITEAVVTAAIKQVKEAAIKTKETATVSIKRTDKMGEAIIMANPEGEIGFQIKVKGGSTEGDIKHPNKGNGEPGNPYVYVYPNEAELDFDFVNAKLDQAKNSGKTVYVRLENTFKKYLDVDNYIRYESVVTFTPEGNVYFYVTLFPEPTPTPTPPETPTPTPTPGGGGGISKAEREEMIQEAKETILKDEVSYRQLQLDIKNLTETVNSGIVYATVAGTVTKVNPEASAGRSMVEITGGSGVYVACIIGETDRETYAPGTVMEGFSYDSGQTVVCRITSLDDTPMSESNGNGGNPNSSSYLARMEVIGSNMPKPGEYIEFSMDSSLVDNGILYLFEAFVSEENGKKYIYVVRDGIVRRTPVTTGSYVQRYVEIRGVELSRDDYIVYPGEPRCRDGAKAELSTESVYYYG